MPPPPPPPRPQEQQAGGDHESFARMGTLAEMYRKQGRDLYEDEDYDRSGRAHVCACIYSVTISSSLLITVCMCVPVFCVWLCAHRALDCFDKAIKCAPVG